MNIMRKNRSKEILETFTKQPRLVHSVKDISDKTGISERQVKNYIRQINCQTAPRQMIQSISSGNFRLCENYQELLPVFQQPEYLPKERASISLSLVVRLPTCVILSFRISILFARTLTRLRISF